MVSTVESIVMGHKPLRNSVREYSHVTFTTYQGQTVVVKRISSREREFFSLTGSLDCVLAPLTVIDDHAYYPFLDQGDLVNGAQSFWVRAVEAAAELTTIPIPPVLHDIPRTDLDEYTGRIEDVCRTASEAGVELSSDGIDFLFTVSRELDFQDSLIHNDLIALNILIKEDTVAIIDWETVRIDFSEKDVGRLLGDLSGDNPRPAKYYYPHEWHNSLVRHYLCHRERLSNQYDIHRGARNIKFAQLWNYLGPISSMLHKRQDLDSEWFQVNLATFNQLSRTDSTSWLFE